jgi:vitamin B12 transporter
MFKLPSPLGLAGRVFSFSLLAAAGVQAQVDPIALAPIVTTATRTPESQLTLGTAVDLISGADLARQQLSTLADALSGIPGAPIFATGQSGAAASIFLRGANSDQTLFLVDGIRLNDPNTDYANFLSAQVCACDSLEIAHGPQSTLYGGEAVGGVISLRSERGVGSPTEAVSAEAGSFDTIQGAVSAQGAPGALAYNLVAAGGHTENARPNNDFDSANLTLRLDDALTKSLGVGVTLRGFDGRYGDPGDIYTNNPYNYEREENWLGTVFAEDRISDDFSTHLTVGGQDRRYVAVTPEPGEPAGVTVVKNLRGVVDWQITGRATENNRVTAGITADDESTQNTGFGAIDHRQTLFAVFAEDEWNPIPNVYLTGGLRRDDYDTFGSDDTGRVTLVWLGGNHVLKLRGSYATGFNAPSFLDLYGQNPFFVGNPKLVAETAKGGDVGLDFYAPANAGAVSLTAFRTDYHNLIEDNFDVFPATTVNVDRARTEGVELSVKTTIAGAVQVKVAYTNLIARNVPDQTPLLRRPRNSYSADFWMNAGNGFSIGAGGVYVGQRADIDAQTFETIADPQYTVVRTYAQYQVNRHLALKARVENMFNQAYAPVNGYPEPGIGYFGGAEWRF